MRKHNKIFAYLIFFTLSFKQLSSIPKAVHIGVGAAVCLGSSVLCWDEYKKIESLKLLLSRAKQDEGVSDKILWLERQILNKTFSKNIFLGVAMASGLYSVGHIVYSLLLDKNSGAGSSGNVLKMSPEKLKRIFRGLESGEPKTLSFTLRVEGDMTLAEINGYRLVCTNYTRKDGPDKTWLRHFVLEVGYGGSLLDKVDFIFPDAYRRKIYQDSAFWDGFYRGYELIVDGMKGGVGKDDFGRVLREAEIEIEKVIQKNFIKKPTSPSGRRRPKL